MFVFYLLPYVPKQKDDLYILLTKLAYAVCLWQTAETNRREKQKCDMNFYILKSKTT